jgi:serine/threonine-protein kinase
LQQQPGTLIEGKYEILGKIHEGGMGTIYKVRHRLLDEIRVVKVMKPNITADEEMKSRFADEAKMATRLKHPNIGTIHDFALDDDGTAYLVMEYIDGLNLAELLHSKGPPGVPLVLEIMHQALLALGYLHRRNVIHRDVAPDNLMLTQDDEGNPRVKLIDLGIAKALDRPVDLTSTGVFLGKLKYASPEQYGALPSGERLDGRSDLYCLGVVVYELLTESRPFAGETPAELLRAHLFSPPIPFEESDPEGKVPSEVRSLVLKALEKKREDRFATAEEFDREVVAQRVRFARPTDLEGTVAVLSRARRASRESAAVTVTPSAQNRLDRQFAAHTTPHPSSPPLGTPPTATRLESATIASARDASGNLPAAVTPAPGARPKFKRGRVGALITVAVLAVGIALFLSSRRQKDRREASGMPVPSTPTAAALVVQAQPTPEPSVLPTVAPTEAPLLPPTAVAPVAESAAARRAAEEARIHAAHARSGAEKARAAEVASDAFGRATAKQREAQVLFERRNYAAAQSAFELAAQLFDAAQMRSETISSEARRPSPVIVAVPAPPTARPEPTRAPATAVAGVEPVRPPAVPPTVSVRNVASEEEKIRDVIHRYEKAQSTLDADLYARIFPSVDREKVRVGFESLRSQTLEFDIQKIEIASGGTSAVARGYEKRTALPRVGSEQRFNGERVIHLEKRAEGWVIARLGS